MKSKEMEEEPQEIFAFSNIFTTHSNTSGIRMWFVIDDSFLFKKIIVLF